MYLSFHLSPLLFLFASSSQMSSEKFSSFLMAAMLQSLRQPMKASSKVEDEGERVTSGPEKKKFRMISGSSYIPKEKPGKPQGEDAHFICAEKNIIGVADGVGGWSQKGIDAGEYARQLMSKAEDLVMHKPINSMIDPGIVLIHAYAETNAQGSSTACIMQVHGQSLKAVNMGDSGFLLIKKDGNVYKSPIQQHSFNCPYQLENNNIDNTPFAAQDLRQAVEAGDVIVAGTDGLFDNLFSWQIEEVVRTLVERGSDPQDVAWAVAGQAYCISMDREAFTPFTEASKEAGKPRFGGKADDITVIVSYIVEE